MDSPSDTTGMSFFFRLPLNYRNLQGVLSHWIVVVVVVDDDDNDDVVVVVVLLFYCPLVL